MVYTAACGKKYMLFDLSTYEGIVSFIFTIITAILALPTAYMTVFMLIGLFTRKTYPHVQRKGNYGVVISARNEEKVVGNLIASVRGNDYPQQRLTIFVIAHNCTDKTAQVARQAGAVVYEYNNPDERTKGYALKYLFSQIEKDYGIQTFDGYLMLDADNIVSENYVDKMNDAFMYWKGQSAITSFRNSKNFGQNVMSGLYGLHFVSGCRYESRGRTVCGCSARVQGTGFLIPSFILKDGWKYVTLTEDWEFTADQILEGNRIRYCDEAEFWDEQPTTTKIMLRQRLRWAKGHLLVFFGKSRQLFCSLFRRKTKCRGSAYDILACIIPYAVIGLFAGIIQFILLSPLFGVPFLNGQSVGECAQSNWVSWVIYLAAAYLSYAVPAALLFIVERKRIRGLSAGRKVAIVLLWPLFNLLNLPLQVVALFKKVEWKVIPHEAAITHETLNEQVRQAEQAQQVAATKARPQDVKEK